MRVDVRLIVIVAVMAAAAFGQDMDEEVRGGRFIFHFRASEIGNLTWQLDTMAGLTDADEHAYRMLWLKDLGWTSEDDQRLVMWRELAQRYRPGPSGSRKRAAYPPNFPRYYGNTLLRGQNAMIAGLEATTVSDYERRLRSVLSRPVAKAFAAIVGSLMPRFHSWWRKEGTMVLRDPLRQFPGVVRDYGLMQFAEAMAQFVEADLPRRHVISFSLMARPKRYSRATIGTHLRNHTVVELMESELATDRISVLMHELTHHFYDRASIGKHVRLIEAFGKAPEPYSMAAYTFLNEAVATAAGMLVEKRLRKPEEFAKFVGTENRAYNDRFISRMGRAVLPLLDHRMEHGLTKTQSLFQGFVPEYLAAVHKTLGPLTESPLFHLAGRAVIAAPDVAPAKELLRRAVRAIAVVEGWERFREYPNLDTVVLLTSAELRRLRNSRGAIPVATIKHLGELAREYGSFAFSIPRSPKARVYILVGRDADAVERAVQAFAGNDVPFDGLRYEAR